MSKTIAALLVMAMSTTLAQADSSNAPSAASDPDIRTMIDAISTERIEADIRTLVNFGTRHTLSDPTDDARGIGAARRWIKAQFDAIAAEAGGRITVEYQSYQQSPPARRITAPVQIVNVIATLKGTQPESADRVYVVSAHYDSICSDPTDAECDAPGANDDASGTAAVIELARVMSRHEFDATIVFMTVAGEEQGLYGSAYAAEQFKANGVNVAGMITNDIIGSSVGQDGSRDDKHVRVFSEGVPEIETPMQADLRHKVGSENDSAARQLARFTVEAASWYLKDFEPVLIFRRDRLMRGGDHKPFSLAGYPAIRFTEMNEDYRHQHQNVREVDGVQYGDLPEFVDFAYTANVTRVNAAALASLARAPAPPANCRLLIAKLTPDTTLRWDKGREPDLLGYEVVWRATTSPQWEHSRFVGDAVEHTLNLNKDNFVFGVRSVDQAGHRSVVAFAWPAEN